MAETPETRYARRDGAYIGYQVFGSGPRDLLFITNWGTNLDAMWEEPSLVRYFDRLGSFARVICFDKRGTGISDPVELGALPNLEDWMDDARVVVDAVGADPVVVFGDTDGAVMAMLFAATYPDRVSAVILVNAYPRLQRDVDYRIGLPIPIMDRIVAGYEQLWGTGEMLDWTAPSVATDARFRRWFGRYQRLSMPPGAATRFYDWVRSVDVRPALPLIDAPTLVVHRSSNRVYRPVYGRYIAEAIPKARFVELAGADVYPFHVGADPVLEEVEAFLTGARRGPSSHRQLATVMFTDIVESTALAGRLGDARWHDLRDAHDSITRRQLARFEGVEVNHTGDGFLARFDGPARAVRCALAIAAAVGDIGLQVRVGLHAGEVEVTESHVTGIAVHIAARVVSAAPPGAVYATGTVRDLAVGSGLEFESRGDRPLKGAGTWALYEVVANPI
jgi:class 3 adenylate cyclase